MKITIEKPEQEKTLPKVGEIFTLDCGPNIYMRVYDSVGKKALNKLNMEDVIYVTPLSGPEVGAILWTSAAQFTLVKEVIFKF